MRIQGNIPASQVNDSQHLKGIGHHIQKPLLFPYGIRNIRSGQADPAQPQVRGGNSQLLCLDFSGPAHYGIRKRIGVLPPEPLQYIFRLQHFNYSRPVLGNQLSFHHVCQAF